MVSLGSDHAGVALKAALVLHLRAAGHEVLDRGPSDETSVDYPDYAALVCRDLLSGEALRGILVCGSGIGMSIAANRFPGIRAALCFDEELARLSRAHNDANVLCLGARFVDAVRGCRMVDAWLATPFEGGRHGRRVAKLDEVYCGN